MCDCQIIDQVKFTISIDTEIDSQETINLVVSEDIVNAFVGTGCVSKMNKVVTVASTSQLDVVFDKWIKGCQCLYCGVYLQWYYELFY